MPDDRMIHRRMLRGDRIASLTDFERGVWLAYQLIADDYGVMRLSAVDLQKAVWLERKPKKTVQKAFEVVVKSTLITSFQDGDRTYVFQPDWNTWQNVRHPRGTIEPCPPIESLRKCDERTIGLFLQHPRCPTEFLLEVSRKTAEELRQSSGNGSAEVPKDFGFTRTPALAEANAKATARAQAKGNGSQPNRADAERAGDFIERYKALHVRLRNGAHYLGKPTFDFQEALQLVAVYDDARLDKLAYVWLNTDHEFAQNGTRTLAKFRSMASWCEERLIAWEGQHGPLNVEWVAS